MTLTDLEQGKILVVDKPYGWTSFQVVNKIKWQIKRDLGVKKFKIGHAGTLDPLATGVLLVCVGKATKMIEQLQTGEKTYSGTIVIGATTPCYDLEQAIDKLYPYQHITLDTLQQSVQELTGTFPQVPPMFSAIKVAGDRAYSYARNGEPVEIAPKMVTIHQFDITSFRPGTPADEETLRRECGLDQPSRDDAPTRELYRSPQGKVPPQLPQMDFKIRCSKGTYIRSIARDLGLMLGSGGFLSALRREQVGDYTLDSAIAIRSNEPVML